MFVENKLCPICKSKSIKLHYKNIILNKNLLKCKNCEIEYLDPYPTDVELDELYSENYASWGSDSNYEFTSMKKEKFKRLLSYVKKYYSNGRLLDIGCGPGYLLEVANKMRFDSYGVEYGEYAANIAINKFGEEKIYNGILEDCSFYDDFFDIVVMSDVLEHVMNPIDTLSKANKILKSTINSIGGGYIVITTPNTNSFTCRIMKKKWPHYNLGHIHCFNDKSIRELANNTGFEVVEMKPFFKILTINYMKDVFKFTNRKLFYTFFNFLSKIPLVSNLKLPILIGEFIIFLKKKENVL